MATIEAPKHKDFEPHPEGSFLAVMRDNYIRERPNPWKGLPRDKNNPSKGLDNRETITEIVLEFLTEHVVETDKDMLPGLVSFRATPSLAENANLRKFLKGWYPALKEEDFVRFDADKLIGKGAYITVSHTVNKKGQVWANVIGAMQPPKGSEIPPIPKDFVRFDDRKQEAPPHTIADAPQQADKHDDDLPF